ncbi:D(1) dopamine receptor-like [Ptychodera flava]|uniref:D(1) dopamine receptor-like n=1 Tax=Ptychodera flava TaxID=63121 RepID=UPI00396A0574
MCGIAVVLSNGHWASWFVRGSCNRVVFDVQASFTVAVRRSFPRIETMQSTVKASSSAEPPTGREISTHPELEAANTTFDSLTVEIPVGTLLLGITVFTLFGNCLIFYAVFTFKRLRTSSNFIITSLAVSDLLTGLFVMPFRAVTDLSGQWYFGSTFCDLWIAMDVMCGIASVLNLILISVDRCLAIKQPFRYKFLMSKFRVCVAISVIWVASVVYAFTPVCTGWNTFGINEKNFVKTDRGAICFYQLSIQAALSYFVLSFAAPSVMMLVIFCQVYRATRLRSRRINIVVEPLAQNGINNENGDRSAASVPAINKSIEARACKKLGIILGIFIVCWTPFYAIQCARSYCPRCVSPTVQKISCWLATCDAAIIPAMYIRLNAGFRKVFLSILARFFFCIGDVEMFDDENSNSLTNYSQNLPSVRSTVVADSLEIPSSPRTPRTPLRDLSVSRA